jgi:hypothetical protein
VLWRPSCGAARQTSAEQASSLNLFPSSMRDTRCVPGSWGLKRPSLLELPGPAHAHSLGPATQHCQPREQAKGCHRHLCIKEPVHT